MSLSSWITFWFKCMVLLDKVLSFLAKYFFYCKLEKCSFLRSSTTFFRFDITVEGFSISIKIVAAVKA